MIEERAILHFNKFKNLRNQVVRDSLTGYLYKIVKVRLEKNATDDYSVLIQVRNQLTDQVEELDSDYAFQNFKELRNT